MNTRTESKEFTTSMISSYELNYPGHTTNVGCFWRRRRNRILFPMGGWSERRWWRQQRRFLSLVLLFQPHLICSYFFRRSFLWPKVESFELVRWKKRKGGGGKYVTAKKWQMIIDNKQKWVKVKNWEVVLWGCLNLVNESWYHMILFLFFNLFYRFLFPLFRFSTDVNTCHAYTTTQQCQD